MKKTFIIIFLFHFIIPPLQSKTVVKCETAPGFINSEYDVYITTCFVTKEKKRIAKGTVTENGFSFEVDNDKVRMLDIEINDYTKRLFVDKDSEYTIRYVEQLSRFPVVLSEPRENINNEIRFLTELFDTLNRNKGVAKGKDYVLRTFLFGNMRHSQLKLMRSLVIQATELEQHLKSKFLSDYFLYYLAPYRAVLIQKEYGTDSLTKYKNALFDNEPLLSNPAYQYCFYFFSQTVNHFIYTNTAKRKKLDFSLTSYLNFLSKFDNKILQNLAKLILLENKLGYSDYKNNRQATVRILDISDSIGGHSGSANIKNISQSIHKKYSQSKIRIKAPDFTLQDKNGSKVSLKDFKGQYVYIDFWAVWCNHCREHHKELAGLSDPFLDSIQFISISVDRYKKSMVKYMNKHPKYNWLFLWAGEKSKVEKDYDVYGCPQNFLINKQGEIVYRTGAGIKKELQTIKNLINE